MAVLVMAVLVYGRFIPIPSTYPVDNMHLGSVDF